jgi:flagellar FliL protein
MADKKADGDAGEEKKGKSKLLLIIIGVVVLLGVGGGVFFMSTRASASTAAGAATTTVEETPGKVISMSAITINLTDGHYLKLGLAIQATTNATEKPDGSKALDLAVNEFSNKTVAELSNDEARNKLKDDLKEKVVKGYEEGYIMDVYFTEFVMQ